MVVAPSDLVPSEVKIVVDKVKSKPGLFGQLQVPALILGAGLIASGCTVAGTGMPDLADSNKLVTHSVVEKTKPAGIEATDAELIKTTVSWMKFICTTYMPFTVKRSSITKCLQIVPHCRYR